MRVKILDYDAAGNETYRDTCDLLDCFPDGNDDPEYRAASEKLQTVGRAWIGGGATPLVLLMRA